MKVIASNKRARFDYDIAEKLIAGIVLSGPETKSAKAGHISLKGSFVSTAGGEAYLTGAHITPYAQAGPHVPHEPERSRKLLIHRRQLDQIVAAKQAGLSVVPLAAGVERGFVKVEVGIGRSKKRYDKRQTIKSRDTTRELSRAVKNRTGHKKS